LKVMQGGPHSGPVVTRFEAERQVLARLEHPGIARVFDAGADSEGRPYFVMELVRGLPLTDFCERHELPLAERIDLMLGVCRAVQHAHQKGVIHRDLKPSNVLVTLQDGRPAPKVIDFGIARALGRLGDTSSGSLKGKLGYMAPEQARGEAIDARADIFSLGVVLWECVAGRRLFLRENELATLRAVVYEPIPKVSKFTKVDPVLEVIIEHALARDLDERFQTAEEMRIALERWIFASGGSSTHDLASLMKAWFPSDHVQWQRAARLALDMQESDPPIDMAFPELAASRAGGSRTGTSHPGSSGSGNRSHLDLSGRVPSGMMQMPRVGTGERPLPRHRGFLVFVVLLAAAVLGGLFWYTRKPPEPPVVLPAETPVPRPTVEILPPGTVQPTTGSATGKPAGVGASGAQSQTQEPGAVSPDKPGTAKRKIRGTPGEKRAILK